MRIFLETSVLSDADLSKFSELVLQRYVKGYRFFICSVSHFQIEWGYSMSNISPQKYKEFLNGFGIDVAPLTKLDSEEAYEFRACVKTHLISFPR